MMPVGEEEPFVNVRGTNGGAVRRMAKKCGEAAEGCVMT